MIKTSTVLVLGAGASMGYGFPSGIKLKAEICKAIRTGQGPIYKDLELSANAEIVQQFYQNLLLSSEMSIDAFLEHNKEYYKIGVRAIASILLRKELHNGLFENWIDKWLDADNNENHWYQLLFSKLNAPFEDFQKNKLTIITFNYDRSLEYFLLKSMISKYANQLPEEVIKKLRNIPILHMYGKLGSLPDYDLDGDFVPYNLFEIDAKHRDEIYNASNNIVTIHQAEQLEATIKEAQKYMLEAKRIFFLGFGYDKTNMERLFFSDGENLLADRLGGQCFGTAYGLSPHHLGYLQSFGMARMKGDATNRARGISYRPLCFPDCKIYDFLYHNPYSVLD